MVEKQLPKLMTRVRFPSPAPHMQSIELSPKATAFKYVIKHIFAVATGSGLFVEDWATS